MRTAAKRDAGERAIIATLEANGCWVHQINDSNGFPDLIVHDRRTALDFYMEVKTPGEKLTRKQRHFWECSPASLRKFVVHNPEEALWLIESHRSEYSH